MTLYRRQRRHLQDRKEENKIKQVNRFKKKEEAPPAASATRDGLKCFSAIHISATRCSHCTSELINEEKRQ